MALCKSSSSLVWNELNLSTECSMIERLQVIAKPERDKIVGFWGTALKHYHCGSLQVFFYDTGLLFTSETKQSNTLTYNKFLHLFFVFTCSLAPLLSLTQCVYVLCVHAHMWISEVDIWQPFNIISIISSILLLDMMILLLDPKLIIWTRLADPWVPRICPFSPTSTKVTKILYYAHPLCGVEI